MFSSLHISFSPQSTPIRAHTASFQPCILLRHLAVVLLSIHCPCPLLYHLPLPISFLPELLLIRSRSAPLLYSRHIHTLWGWRLRELSRSKLLALETVVVWRRPAMESWGSKPSWRWSKSARRRIEPALRWRLGAVTGWRTELPASLLAPSPLAPSSPVGSPSIKSAPTSSPFPSPPARHGLNSGVSSWRRRRPSALFCVFRENIRPNPRHGACPHTL